MGINAHLASRCDLFQRSCSLCCIAQCCALTCTLLIPQQPNPRLFFPCRPAQFTPLTPPRYFADVLTCLVAFRTMNRPRTSMRSWAELHREIDAAAAATSSDIRGERAVHIPGDFTERHLFIFYSPHLRRPERCVPTSRFSRATLRSAL